MKDHLFKQSKTREFNKLFHAYSHTSTKQQSSVWSSNKTTTVWLFISVLIITLSFSTVSAQPVENIDNYKKKISLNAAQQIDNLVKGEISTLFIYENKFETEGNSSPTTAAVELESLNQIYSANTKFKNIELIRIIVRNTNDLKYKIDIEKLSHFKKLKYVYVVVAFDICTENPYDIDCQKSEITKMISFPKNTTTPVVLFQTISLI